MFTFKWDGHQIFVTNGSDINMVQAFDPSTGKYFTSEEEAITWAKQFLESRGFKDTFVSDIEELRAAKIAEAKKLYQNELAKGFDSDASGVMSHYAYDEAAATKLSKLFLLKANHMVQYPTPVFSVTNEMQMLDEEQLTKLLADVSKFEWDIQFKYHNLSVSIDACKTEEELKNLEIKF